MITVRTHGKINEEKLKQEVRRYVKRAFIPVSERSTGQISRKK